MKCGGRSVQTQLPLQRSEEMPLSTDTAVVNYCRL